MHESRAAKRGEPNVVEEDASSGELEDARYVLRKIVIPNYRDFLANQLSPRHAFNSAISIAHMVDHIVIRGGGKRGEIGNLAKDFAERSPPFRYAQAMCNAIKHVYATGGGSPTPIMTATGVTVADVEEVLFTDVLDGKLKAFRPNAEILMCDISENGEKRRIMVGWTLFEALLFVARELGVEVLALAEGPPAQVDMRYRDVE